MAFQPYSEHSHRACGRFPSLERGQKERAKRMNLKLAVVCTAVLAVSAAACTKSSPTRPTDAASAGTSTASVTDATTGVTVTTPTLVSPADGFRFKYSDQPITLTINNAATTGGTITYSFQVATDAGFANIAFSKDGVAAGASTTTQ